MRRGALMVCSDSAERVSVCTFYECFGGMDDDALGI